MSWMEEHLNARKRAQDSRKPKVIPVVSEVINPGVMLETVRSGGRTAFVLWREGKWSFEKEFSPNPHQRWVPYSASNNLLQNNVVLFPSEPEEYETEEKLLAEIQAFIHRYVDVSPLFEKVASYYVLFSWVHDAFNELPYLRLRGDPGSGKTRFLLTVGSLCYKPIFASGASTVSPLFRILDAFRGTLIVDEGDFRMSDEKAEVVKILNNGNVRGFPVLRSEVTPKGEYNPHAFAVFGPKLVATRGYFQDRALESRFLTEEMGLSSLRKDVPINLPAACRDEALHLRNKLLLFRFRNLSRCRPVEGLVDKSIEPRLNQVFVPLLSIVEDPKAREEMRALARKYNGEMVAERGMDIEAQVLEVIKDMAASSIGERLSVKDITNWFTDRYGEEYERRITSKYIGSLIRRRLRLKTQKSHGVYVIPPSELPRLETLCERYGIGDESKPEPEVPLAG